MAADTTESLPRYLAPLPWQIETVALRYAWAIVAINLAGTAFGFWYYIPQFRLEPVLAWPVVPDSPVATLFIACSLASPRVMDSISSGTSSGSTVSDLLEWMGSAPPGFEHKWERASSAAATYSER